MISFLSFLNEKKMCETHLSADQVKDLKAKHPDDKELMSLLDTYADKDDEETYQKIKAHLASKD